MKYGTMSYICINGETLMVKKGIRENDPNSEFCTLPGGNLESFEKGLQNSQGRLESAIRETADETGLKLIESKFVGTILFDNSERIFDNWENPQDFLVYMFVANDYSGKLKNSREGKALWVLEKDFMNISKNVGDNKMYEWLKDSRYFMGVIKIKGKNILDEENTFVDYF